MDSPDDVCEVAPPADNSIHGYSFSISFYVFAYNSQE